MSLKIRRVKYYTANVADRIGTAYEVLSELAKSDTNLLAFSCVPIGPSTLQVTLFPDDADQLERSSGGMGLALLPPQHAFLIQGDDKIELRGFGSFRVRRRRSRQGRNPKTGDRVDVPEKRIPYFKPGKELKDLINADGEPLGSIQAESPES